MNSGNTVYIEDYLEIKREGKESKVMKRNEMKRLEVVHRIYEIFLKFSSLAYKY